MYHTCLLNLLAFPYILLLNPYIKGVRRLGAASVDMCHVALGIVEAYWEYRLKPWDMAAGVLVISPCFLTLWLGISSSLGEIWNCFCVVLCFGDSLCMESSLIVQGYLRVCFGCIKL